MKASKQYRVKEVFYSLQGEGAHTGRPAVFCRFSKCNLWNGREDSRASAVCKFCDTDFIGTDGQNGGSFEKEALVEHLLRFWPDMDQGIPYLICTGGEPALQLDAELLKALKNADFEIAIETNGTLPLPQGIDWICLSPKGASEIVIQQCDELKLVYPQQDAMPERFSNIQAKHRYLQPMAISSEATAQLIGSDSQTCTRAAVEYCLNNPIWKLSLQTHKWLGID